MVLTRVNYLCVIGSILAVHISQHSAPATFGLCDILFKIFTFSKTFPAEINGDF